MTSAFEKKKKLQEQGAPVDADTLASLRDLNMQLEEIHYLTVEFQKWEVEREEEIKTLTAPPASPPKEPSVDVEQVKEEAAEQQRKKSAKEFERKTKSIQKEAFDAGFEKGFEEGTSHAAPAETASVPADTPEVVASAWALRTIVSRASKILETVEDSDVLT